MSTVDTGGRAQAYIVGDHLWIARDSQPVLNPMKCVKSGSSVDRNLHSFKVNCFLLYDIHKGSVVRANMYLPTLKAGQHQRGERVPCGLI